MFTEEVPADFKQSCPCKRRGCSLQRIFEDRAHNKRFFTYQCSDPKIWASCNKTVAPNEPDPTKPKPPVETELPAAEYPIKCTVEGCKFRFKNELMLNKHREYTHNLPPLATAEPATSSIGSD